MSTMVIFFVYRKTRADLWTVGYYDPQKRWHPLTDHRTERGAAKKVHYLNGGSPLRAEIIRRAS